MQPPRLLVSGVPLGYGPGGVGQIDTDIDYIKKGINNGGSGADCIDLHPNNSQMRCLQDALDNYLDGNLLNDPVFPRGPWCAKGHCRGGGFDAKGHNCGMWVNDALSECGLEASVPDLWAEAIGNFYRQFAYDRCLFSTRGF